MRKLGIVLAALACLSLMAIPALAAKGEFTFGLGGGVLVPTGNFGDMFKMGYGGGVFGDYMVTEQFAVGVDIGYYQVKIKDEHWQEWIDAYNELADDDATVDESFTIMPFGVHGKWLPTIKDSKFSPFVQVGVGFYRAQSKVEVTAADATTAALYDLVNVDVSENKMGFSGGAGVDYVVSPAFKVGVFGAMHNVMTEGESTQFFTAGLNLTFSTAGFTTGGGAK
jgi:outer membrane protein W